MAGAGYKLFNTGDVLTAAQVNTYLNEQTVMVFASSAARTSALSGVLAEGMVSYLQDTNAVEVYNGSAWVGVGNVGDITEVQAGVGISVASGTGPIPVITNSSTDLITTAGDLLYGTAADTVARLGIGAAGRVLKVNSGATAPEWAVDPTTDVVTTAGDLIYGTGADAVTRLGIGTAGQVLKVNSGATAPEWGAAAGGGDFVLITAQTFSASSGVNVNSVFTSTYNNYKVIVNVTSTSTANDVDLRLRASGSDDTNSTYQYTGVNTYSDIDTIYIQRNNGTTSFARAGGSGEDSADNGATNMIWEFFNPQASLRTGVTYHVISSDGSRVIYDSGVGIFDNTTSFDGFSLIVSTGNITGKVYVYGYKV